MNKKMKHLLLALCVCIFGLMMTGCASETTTTIKVKSATKADFSIQVGYDDELLSAIATMSETTTEDLIKELKGSGAVYAKKTINGITYHTFTASAKNAKMTDIEKLLEEAGYTNLPKISSMQPLILITPQRTCLVSQGLPAKQQSFRLTTIMICQTSSSL